MTTQPPHIKPNNLLSLIAQDRVCTAFGIKLFPSLDLVPLAKTAGYDSLFIDHEHSPMSLRDASNICIAALSADITPFVRVPYQCGAGYVQKVIDGGAMGVVFPHVSTTDEARECVRMVKYPPRGERSWTNGLAQFGFEAVSAKCQVEEANAVGSVVVVQIEGVEGLGNVEGISEVEGVDVLLVGTNDLALEMGCMGEWDDEGFVRALRRVGRACKVSGKVMGIAGIYTRPDVLDMVVNEMGARYVLGGIDVGLLSAAMRQNCGALKTVQKT